MKLDEIYNRIGLIAKARKNKDGQYFKSDIAKALHVTPQDISNWAFRNRFPWPELYAFAVEKDLNLDRLFGRTEEFVRIFTNDLDKDKNPCILPELYTEKNRGIHDQIEIILNSGNKWAINFLTGGVDQIAKKVRDEEEMRDQLCKLTDVVAHVVDRLDSIESNLAVSGTEKGVAL